MIYKDNDLHFSLPYPKAHVSFSDQIFVVVIVIIIYVHFQLLTTGPISTRLITKYIWVKGIKFCLKKGHDMPLFQGEIKKEWRLVGMLKKFQDILNQRIQELYKKFLV